MYANENHNTEKWKFFFQKIFGLEILISLPSPMKFWDCSRCPHNQFWRDAQDLTQTLMQAKYSSNWANASVQKGKYFELLMCVLDE